MPPSWPRFSTKGLPPHDRQVPRCLRIEGQTHEWELFAYRRLGSQLQPPLLRKLFLSSHLARAKTTRQFRQFLTPLFAPFRRTPVVEPPVGHAATFALLLKGEGRCATAPLGCCFAAHRLIAQALQDLEHPKGRVVRVPCVLRAFRRSSSIRFLYSPLMMSRRPDFFASFSRFWVT